MNPAAVLSILVKTEGATAASRELHDLDDKGKKSAGGLGKVAKAGGLAGAVLAGSLAKGAFDAVGAFQESEKIAKQTGAVLKSTGGAAGVTAKQVADLAGAISKKTGVDDEAIQSGQNLLLTFTNLKNESGKGNDIFNQTTKIMTDMSVALGQDTKSSALQLGKALNDPIKGVSALQRVGVSFTADQKKQIETMVNSGKTMDAQKLILNELGKEFGGSAEAQATATDKMKVAFGNLQETIGAQLAPAFEKVAGFVGNFVTGLSEGTGAGGAFRDAMVTAWDAVKGAVQAGVEFAKGFLDKHRDDIDAIKKAMENVGQAFKFVFEEVLMPLLPTVESLVKSTFKQIGGAIDLIVGLLTGDWKRAWDGLKAIVQGAVDKMLVVLDLAWDLFKKAGEALVKAVVAGFKALPGLIVDLGKWLISHIDDAIILQLQAILAIGKYILNAIIEGIKAVPDVVLAVGGWVKNRIVDAVELHLTALKEVGGWILGKIMDGLTAVGTKVKDAIETLKDKIVNAIKEVFKDVISIPLKIKLPSIDLPFGIGGGARGDQDPGRGGGLQLPATFTATHETGGLAGYPALDVFGPPGMKVLSPAAGIITRLSGQAGGPGGGGPFGYSMYLRSLNGEYFMTHFGSMAVGVGARVSRGSVLGTIADYPDRADHIHIGRRAFAHGGHAGAGGWSLVGERGPELAYLPSGSQVYSNGQSRGMGGDVIVYIDGVQVETSRVMVERERASRARYRAGLS